MPCCSVCGVILNEGDLCRSCQATSPSRPMQEAAMPANVAALLSYSVGLFTGILFLSIVPYKRNQFIRFHALQSIFFTVAAIALDLLWGMVTTILVSRMNGLWYVFSVLTPLLALSWLGCWGFLMYNAYQHKEYRMPILGGLAAAASVREPIGDDDLPEPPF